MAGGLELFKLFGTIAVNNSEANKSIDETDKKASGFADKLKKGVGSAAAVGAAVSGVAVGATTALANWSKETMSTTDHIDKMSQKIGISAEYYQEMEYAMGQSGASVDSLQMGMKTLVAQMDGVKAGNDQATAAFDRLGVSVLDANGNLRSQEDVMKDTLTALQGVENQAEKARIANMLFGRSGSEMMPMLNGEAGSIDELRQKAHELGVVLDDETVAAGARMNDMWDDASRAFGQVKMKIGAALMPALADLGEGLANMAPLIGDMIEKVGPQLAQSFELIVPVLLELAETLLPVILDVINELMPVFADLVSDLLPPVSEILKMILPPLIEIVQALLPVAIKLIQMLLPIIEALLPLLKPILDLVMLFLEPLLELLDLILPPLIEIFEAVAEVLESVLKGAFEALQPIIESFRDLMVKLEPIISKVWDGITAAFDVAKEFIIDVLGTLVQGITEWWEGVEKIFNGLIDFITGVFTGNWEQAWEGVVQIFEGIWEGMKAIFKAPINWIIDGLNTFIRGVNKIQIPEWVPKVGGRGLNIPEIPKLAKGGIVDRPTIAEIGEAGPEAVTPIPVLQKYIVEAVSEQTETQNRILEKILKKLDDLGGDVVLDTGKIVGGIAPKMDRELEQRRRRDQIGGGDVALVQI